MSKVTKFNAQNKGWAGEKYPLFLGPQLGVVDTINVQYPELEELYQLQLSQIWNEFEVDLTQDKVDMQLMPKTTVDLMVKTIMWQTVADSVASRSIIETLGKYISNSELMNLATLWSFFEVIHARTYSHIIKQTFVQPNELLEELYNDAAVLQRSDIIVAAFDDLANLPNDATEDEIMSKIVLAITALFALEAIAFMSSFAVTFAITETDKFAGIGKLVKFICRDEVLHTRMDYAILNIAAKDPKLSKAVTANVTGIKEIIDRVVQQELDWADYLFSEGREVVGLNAKRLKEYTLYMAKPVYEALGITFAWVAPSKDPLPYMKNYINQGKVQTAAQELQLDNYQVGAIVDDTADLDLSFEF